MIKIRTLKIIILLVIALLLFSAACILFVQFYPFTKSTLRTQFNYPAVTSTATGRPGDPINLMFIGGLATIQEAFLTSGWKIPDTITPKSSAKIAVDSLANLPYPTAPVSNLYLFGRKQDIDFERPSHTVQMRDHIRIWDTHTKIGSEEVWLASATYDDGIEISGKNYMPTHHIAPDVDGERTMVQKALRQNMPFRTIVQFAKPTFFGVNGGGDWYYTDGEAAIIYATNLYTTSMYNQNFVQNHTPAQTIKNWIFGLASCLLRPIQ